MLLLSRSWMVVMIAGVALTFAGCQPKAPAKSAEKTSKPNAAATADAVPDDQPAAEKSKPKHKHKPTIVKAKPEQPPPPPTIPSVAMSNELRAACLVGTGDTMPSADLPGLDGKTHVLESLAGKKLTVVCLWTIGTTRRSQLIAEGVLRDLTNDIAAPFAKAGVRVIGISVGDPPQAVQELASQTGETFPILLDAKGAYFAKIAKDRRMPRVYLLDAGGKILWFDVEFSNASRRNLIEGIQVALGKL
jgi:peroxiredoxin